MSVLLAQCHALAAAEPRRIIGTVTGVRGMTLQVAALPVPVGALVSVQSHRPGQVTATFLPGLGSGSSSGSGPAAATTSAHSTSSVLGEVIALSAGSATVMLLADPAGVRAGDRVIALDAHRSALVGEALLGRIVDGLGRPLDHGPPLRFLERRPLTPPPLGPLQRAPIRVPLATGVRAIDLMTTLGRGQRLGIFAGPGVGKSTLLGSIARRAAADVNVIAMVGERGREVGDFLRESLGPEGLARSVVVVATGDEAPPLRVRAAQQACAVAEHFREQGRDVLLMIDSVTRFAHAQRQIGLAVGEPPATKGYTPSVFAALGLLLERAGAVESATATGGSITGIYTILVEGDDMTEPIADAARGILDGHVILSRKLAQRGHFPAVDVLDSVSRLADAICDRAHAAARQQLTRLLAAYRDVEELVQIGAYAGGSNPETDVAIAMHGKINDLLRQARGEHAPFDEARAAMQRLALEAGEAIRRRAERPPEKGR